MVLVTALVVGLPTLAGARPGADSPRVDLLSRVASLHAAPRVGPLAIAHGSPLGGLTPGAGVASLPAGVGPGRNGVLATLDLTGGSPVPGASTATKNGVTPFASTYDPSNHLLYVAALATNAVLAIDETSRMVVAQIPVGLEPAGVVYDPAGHQVFVANFQSNNVTVIDDQTNRVVANVVVPSGDPNVPSGPMAMAYNALNHTVLVGQYGSGACCTRNVTVIDGLTDQVLTELPAPDDVVALSYNPLDHLLYALGGINLTIGITDLSANRSVGNWSFAFPGSFPSGLAVDPVEGLVLLLSTTGIDSLTLTQIFADTGTISRNTSLPEPGAAFFGPAWPVLSNTTGKVYVTGQTGELFTVTESTGAYVGSSLDGSCLVAVALTASGAPLAVPDACAAAVVWLDGTTARATATQYIGADPVAAVELPAAGEIAVLEADTQRIDLLDEPGLTVSARIPLAIQSIDVPLVLATDPRTGWLYTYAQTIALISQTTTGPLQAYDPATNSIRWTWSPCNGCYLDGVGDRNGTLYVDALSPGGPTDDLYELNATTGAVEGSQRIAIGSGTSGSPPWPQSSVAPVPNASLVVVADRANNSAIAVNTSSGQLAWTVPTGTGTGPLAYLPGSRLVALGATIAGTPSIEFVNATTGAILGAEPIPARATSVVAGGFGDDVLVLNAGDVADVRSGNSTQLPVTVPANASLSGLFPLAGSAGVLAPSRAYGAAFWVGLGLTLGSPELSSPLVQGETFTLTFNVSGGFGAATFRYLGLPEGCAAANSAILSCLPLVAGPVAVSLIANDSTGLPATSDSVQFTLAPYPLNVTIAGPTSYVAVGGLGTFAAQLSAGEAAFASYLNFSWSLSPSTAGTLNRTNASTVTVALSQSGRVELVLVSELRGTTGVARLNLTGTSLSGGTILGLSGGQLLLALGALAAVIVVAVVVIVIRSRRPPPPAPEPGSEPLDPSASDPEPAADDDPAP